MKKYQHHKIHVSTYTEKCFGLIKKASTSLTCIFLLNIDKIMHSFLVMTHKLIVQFWFKYRKEFLE